MFFMYYKMSHSSSFKPPSYLNKVCRLLYMISDPLKEIASYMLLLFRIFHIITYKNVKYIVYLVLFSSSSLLLLIHCCSSNSTLTCISRWWYISLQIALSPIFSFQTSNDFCCCCKNDLILLYNFESLVLVCLFVYLMICF